MPSLQYDRICKICPNRPKFPCLYDLSYHAYSTHLIRAIKFKCSLCPESAPVLDIKVKGVIRHLVLKHNMNLRQTIKKGYTLFLNSKGKFEIQITYPVGI